MLPLTQSKGHQEPDGVNGAGRQYGGFDSSLPCSSRGGFHGPALKGAPGKALVCFMPPSVPQVSQLLPFLFLPHARHSSELWFPQIGKGTCGPGRLTGPGPRRNHSMCVEGLRLLRRAGVGTSCGPRRSTSHCHFRGESEAPRVVGRRKHGATAVSVLGCCSVVPRD